MQANYRDLNTLKEDIKNKRHTYAYIKRYLIIIKNTALTRNFNRKVSLSTRIITIILIRNKKGVNFIVTCTSSRIRYIHTTQSARNVMLL